MIVTIDGYASAGKTTTARGVAQKLGFKYLDSGATYRMAALLIKRKGIDYTDKDKVVKAIKNIKINYDEKLGRLTLDGEDVEKEIRTEEISHISSVIATYEDVRKILQKIQREIGKTGNVVAEGRDMGSFVFPDADIKIFMTADLKERARRRWKELKEKGQNISYEEVLKKMEERDRRDSERKINPLVKPEGAIEIDTTNLTIEEEIEKVIELIMEKWFGKIKYRPIGIIHSPFKEPVGVPIQPRFAKGIRGKIKLFPEFKEGIKDLEGFSHIILIYHFHLVKEKKLKVKPYLDNVKRGVFATRAPSRPNPIGMSTVKLVEIKDNEIIIENVDIVDGTPLLDIKPHIPNFIPPEEVKIGWLSDKLK